MVVHRPQEDRPQEVEVQALVMDHLDNRRQKGVEEDLHPQTTTMQIIAGEDHLALLMTLVTTGIESRKTTLDVQFHDEEHVGFQCLGRHIALDTQLLE
ncbi:hypothetical protein H0H92_000262 [Tricholoma furcatifolium]|nr:hypothetical protein H0H92_000262 [Tricholoma furcatifolium]